MLFGRRPRNGTRSASGSGSGPRPSPRTDPLGADPASGSAPMSGCGPAPQVDHFRRRQLAKASVRETGGRPSRASLFESSPFSPLVWWDSLPSQDLRRAGQAGPTQLALATITPDTE